MSRKHNQHIWWALAFAFFILAVFLRFYNLGQPNLWVDEPYHLYVAESIDDNGSLQLPSGETYGRAKLFAYSTFFSSKLFGLNEFGIRFPSALFGVVVLILFFFFIKRLMNFPVAVIMLFFMAVMPFQIGWARVSRFYTLFQIFTILAWFFFYIGFERTGRQEKYSKKNPNIIFQTIRNWDINWYYLILFVVSTLLAISVQVIGVFILVAVYLYILSNFIYKFITVDLKTSITSKYFFFSTLGVVVFGIVWFLFPQAKAMIIYGISYIPAWAQDDVAQDRLLFFKFIMGKELFPLGAFFLLGIFQCVVRLNRVVFYTAILFITQIFLFTFVFSYRMYQYIYNIFPFFVLIVSYAIVNFLSSEKNYIEKSWNFFQSISRKFKKVSLKYMYIVFFFFIPFSEFFMDGIIIPFYKPGRSNGAVSFLEWKIAADYVRNHDSENSVILTTLPLTIKYYSGRVDYNINLSDYELSKEKLLFDENHVLSDYYSGLPFIESTAKLDSLVQSTESGFIILDTHRLLNDQYISPEMRNYFEVRLKEEFVTPGQTIWIYSWRSGSQI